MIVQGLLTKVDQVVWTGSMRNRVLSYFCHGPYQVEISSRLDLVASTPRVPASTEVDFASTNSSQFVPRMEVVEAVEAIPHTDIESLLMNSEESQNFAFLEKGMGLDRDCGQQKSSWTWKLWIPQHLGQTHSTTSSFRSPSYIMPNEA